MKYLSFLLVFGMFIAPATFAVEALESQDTVATVEQGEESLDAFRYVCQAVNGSGRLFSAVGVIASNTQRRALQQCYSVSLNCRSLGCRIVR